MDCTKCFDIINICAERPRVPDCTVKYNVIGQRLCPIPFKHPNQCKAMYNSIGQKVYPFDPNCPCYPSRPTGYNLTCNYCQEEKELSECEKRLRKDN